MGFTIQRNMQADKIALGRKLVKAHAPPPKRVEIGARPPTVVEQRHVKAAGALRYGAGDSAGTNQAERGAGHVAAQHVEWPPTRKPARPHLGIRLHDTSRHT